MSTIYGQNLRIYLGSSTTDAQVLCASTQCTVHLSASLEEATTKDDVDSTGLWTKQEVTGKSWDMSADVNFVDDNTAVDAADLMSYFGEEVTVVFAKTTGSDNRDKSTVYYTGKGIISDLSISAAAKSKATISVTITGNGSLEEE